MYIMLNANTVFALRHFGMTIGRGPIWLSKWRLNEVMPYRLGLVFFKIKHFIFEDHKTWIHPYNVSATSKNARSNLLIETN